MRKELEKYAGIPRLLETFVFAIIWCWFLLGGILHENLMQITLAVFVLLLRIPLVGRKTAVKNLVWVAVYLLLLVVSILQTNVLVIIVLAFVLIFRMIFFGRDGKKKLKNLHSNYLAAMRKEEAYKFSFWELAGYTAMNLSPVYLLWILSGMFLMFGFGGWIAVAVPFVFLSCIVFKFITPMWSDMGVNTAKFWGLQVLIYLATLLPGFLVACLK